MHLLNWIIDFDLEEEKNQNYQGISSLEKNYSTRKQKKIPMDLSSF